MLRLAGLPVPTVKLDEAEPREGLSIALAGFPLGGALGFSHVTHRGIIAARTGIAAAASNFQGLNERLVRQVRQGAFEVLQLNATAYPGNSGGPIFNLETGAVVGVVNMVIVKGAKEAALSVASGISYAVPARSVAAMLAGTLLK